MTTVFKKRGAIGGLIAMLVVLTFWARSDSASEFDLTLYSSVASWDVPALGLFLGTVSFLTDRYPAMTIGVLSFLFLLVSGRRRIATNLLMTGVFVIGISLIGDVLGDYVGKSSPDGGEGSYPSNHASGTTLFYGFSVYLAVRYRLRRTLLIPLAVASVILIGSTGVSRIYLEAHWPTDVVGGYILGSVCLLTLIYLQPWYEAFAGKAQATQPLLDRAGQREAAELEQDRRTVIL